MKKLLIIIAMLTCAISNGRGQQPLPAQEMIAITPVVSDEADLPSDARGALEQKLRQLATLNGFGSTSGRFALTSNVVTVDKQTTATTPVQFIVTLDVSFYVVDVIEQTIIDDITLHAKGIDKMEHKASIRAINGISVRTPQMRRFMSTAREKIVDYYATHIPTIILEADTYAQMGNYDMALFILSDVPESVDGYPVVLERMVDINNMKVEEQVTLAITRAKAEASAGNTSKAVEIISSLETYGTRWAEVEALAESLGSDVTISRSTEIDASGRSGQARRTNDDPGNGNVSDKFMDSLNKWFSNAFK